MQTEEEAMPLDLGTDDRAALEDIVTGLQNAWNAADGSAFAAPFAEDADFVDIRGDHHRGRAAIAAGHDAVLRTIYAGSRNRYTVESARMLSPDVALVHVRSALEVPQGPMAGEHGACFSLVFTRESGGWKIASLHNTLEGPKGPPRN
jgi:uncharacterized protein (TIGR02246 family)